VEVQSEASQMKQTIVYKENPVYV